MQTNLFNARNGKVQGTEKRRDFADKLCLQMQTMGARFADKVCLKMQTNFADKPLQDTPPPNADKRLQKCRRARWGFGQIADELCRQRLSANRAGTPAFLFVYTTLQGLSTAKCRQGLSTVFGGFFADKVCLQSLSTGLVCTIWECRQSLSTGLKSLSKAFCKVVCGNADKVCLEITSFSLFKYSIINFVSSHRVRRLSLESSY